MKKNFFIALLLLVSILFLNVGVYANIEDSLYITGTNARLDNINESTLLVTPQTPDDDIVYLRPDPSGKFVEENGQIFLVSPNNKVELQVMDAEGYWVTDDNQLAIDTCACAPALLIVISGYIVVHEVEYHQNYVIHRVTVYRYTIIID